MREKWAQIEGFNNYVVSDQGRVKNKDTNRILKQQMNQQGIVFVRLSKDGRLRTISVNRLVATAFVPNRYPDIDNSPFNKDRDRTNNTAENLVWRPRWYAIQMMQEKDKRARSQYRVMEVESGLIFEDSSEAAYHYGIRDTHVLLSVMNGTPAFVHKLYFRKID